MRDANYTGALAEALAMVEAKVGKVTLGFAGESCSIADKVVNAELTPATKKPEPSI